MSGINQKYHLTEKICNSLEDRRDQRYTKYELEQLIAQRLFQIACGYEDCNDANSLRNDLIFKVATQRDIDQSLASQPTLSRLENSISYKELYRLAETMLSLYLETKARNTKRIILDVDLFADPAYGNQQLTFFHGYYGEKVYLPLPIFDAETGKLVTLVLLPGNTWGGSIIVRILKRVIKKIRERFPDVEIIIRADAGFTKPDLYEYCEKDTIGYIIGFAGNERLEALNEDNLRWACFLYRITGEAQRLISSFEYQADSWGKPRRVIVKTEWNEKGPNQRFLVTDLSGDAEEIYEECYSPRGEECENRIKELKLDLKAGRLSCSDFKANQFRLLLHGFAYWLLHLLREENLKGTELEKAQMGTIRLRLLKIGAQIVATYRRIWIHLATGYPLKELFSLVVSRLGFSSA